MRPLEIDPRLKRGGKRDSDLLSVQYMYKYVERGALQVGLLAIRNSKGIFVFNFQTNTIDIGLEFNSSIHALEWTFSRLRP